MCGIVGLASSESMRNIGIEAMMRKVAHRGPDDEGTWISSDRRVVFGHRRLAIIDLTPGGHQPMTDASQKLWLIFNGEIYNFQELRRELESAGFTFRTRSDSEVILQAYRRWGERCVDRFNGMFAFALYDAETEKVFFARDRIGKKPLFYCHQGTRLAFGSEAKAVIASRIDRQWPLDPHAVNAYLTFGYIPGERSIFAGVRRLLPGHSMTYDLRANRLSFSAYWAPSASLDPPNDVDADVLVSELEALLDDSVRLRMIADVPQGILLSGGVDSSLITAIAARHSSRRVKTFTVTFPGGGLYDESAHAQKVAEHFGTEHHELPLPTAGLDVLRKLAHHLDEPFADPSVLPTFLISQLTRRHVTVALGGDGGDELFGGYAWYRQGLTASKTLMRIPAPLRRIAARLAGSLPVGIRGRNFIRSQSGDLCHYQVTTATMFEPELRRKLLSQAIVADLGNDLELPERERCARWPAVSDPMLQMSLLDLQTYLPDDILVKVDRASMAVALEMRAPLLDYRIIEFALRRVPSHLKVADSGSRFLQRKLARRLLPPSLDLDRKQGFVMPIHEWLRGEWGAATVEVMRSPLASAWIEPAVADDLLKGQRKGRTNGIRLFTLLMFALWLEGAHSNEASAPMACAATA